MKNIDYSNGGIELLDRVEPLWKRLNNHHKSKSKHFVNRYEGFTFETRRKKFEEKDTVEVSIDLVRDLDKDELIGYCISTLNKDSVGEIDSLYIDPEYRGMKIGDTLMVRGLNWLNSKGASKKIIGVAAGNEEVLEFYAHFGFRPRTIILEEVPK